MRDEGVDPGIVHACNSPATILHPEAHLDMVRCGIAIYGCTPRLLPTAASICGRR
jgi:alanine racemase